jgi:hypothetical protein
MINSKIDEENDTNKLDEENDKPINELNDSVRSNEDSPPMKKNKTIKSKDNHFYFN